MVSVERVPVEARTRVLPGRVVTHVITTSSALNTLVYVCSVIAHQAGCSVSDGNNNNNNNNNNDNNNKNNNNNDNSDNNNNNNTNGNNNTNDNNNDDNNNNANDNNDNNDSNKTGTLMTRVSSIITAGGRNTQDHEE